MSLGRWIAVGSVQFWELMFAGDMTLGLVALLQRKGKEEKKFPKLAHSTACIGFRAEVCGLTYLAWPVSCGVRRANASGHSTELFLVARGANVSDI